MQFTIGQKIYSVVIVSTPLIEQGQPCRAVFDNSRRLISISADVAREDRCTVLLHELRHAWIENFGRADEVEADADQVSEMMRVLMRQFNSQGGEPALEAMEPIAPPSATRSMRGPLPAMPPHCGACDASVAFSSIATSPATFNQDLGTYTVERGFCCPTCDAINVWSEFSNQDGAPTGTPLHYPPPRVLKGKDAVQWMTAHSELCRVIVYS